MTQHGKLWLEDGCWHLAADPHVALPELRSMTA